MYINLNLFYCIDCLDHTSFENPEFGGFISAFVLFLKSMNKNSDFLYYSNGLDPPCVKEKDFHICNERLCIYVFYFDIIWMFKINK